MRRQFSVAAVVVALAGCVLLPASPAAAGDCPPGTTPQDTGQGTVCVPVVDPGDPGSGDPGGGPGGGGSATCTYQGHRLPCVTDQGVWFSSHQCYAQPMNPPPPAGDSRWGGQDPAEGNVWRCTRPGVAIPWLYFFVANGTTPALVDPGELAQSALDSMTLEVPEVHTAPTPPDMTYVNLDTWLWMGESQFRSLRLTVSAGGTSVTVTAVPVSATWAVGDGNTVVCESAGRPWVRGMTDAAKTDCSYTYEKVSDFEPHGKFRITSTLTYQVDWACSGSCLAGAGTLGLVDGLPGTGALRVGERQSVVVGSS